MNAAMNPTTNKLTLLIAILALTGCSPPNSATVSTLAQAAVSEAGLVAQGWFVHHSRAEPLCPLCIQQPD